MRIAFWVSKATDTHSEICFSTAKTVMRTRLNFTYMLRFLFLSRKYLMTSTFLEYVLKLLCPLFRTMAVFSYHDGCFHCFSCVLFSMLAICVLFRRFATITATLKQLYDDNRNCARSALFHYRLIFHLA